MLCPLDTLARKRRDLYEKGHGLRMEDVALMRVCYEAVQIYIATSVPHAHRALQSSV